MGKNKRNRKASSESYRTGNKSPTENPSVKKFKQINSEVSEDLISDTESVYMEAEEPPAGDETIVQLVSEKNMASNSNTSEGDGLVGALVSAFKNPEVVSSLVEALKSEICKVYEGELSEMKLIIDNQKDEIKNLRQELNYRTDELEMYGRRNGVRLHGIPENSTENIDEIVMKIAREIGADIPDMALSICL